MIGTVKLQETFGRGGEDIMLFVEVSLYGVELSNVPSFQERAVETPSLDAICVSVTGLPAALPLESGLDRMHYLQL